MQTPKLATPRLVAWAAFVLALVAVPALAGAQDAIFLVRHAERLNDSTDSPLSAEGQARAARLAQMLRDAGITAVYATEFQRTIDTARPLAELLKISIENVPASEPAALVAKLRGAPPRARILVVSHSDRLPALLKDLGVQRDITIPASQYDDLFIVLPVARKEPMLVRLRY